MAKSLFSRVNPPFEWRLAAFAEALRQVRTGWSRHGAERVLRGGDDGLDLRTEAERTREDEDRGHDVCNITILVGGLEHFLFSIYNME